MLASFPTVYRRPLSCSIRHPQNGMFVRMALLVLLFGKVWRGKDKQYSVASYGIAPAFGLSTIRAASCTWS